MKQTKRVLSMVLAGSLVLTMAPAPVMHAQEPDLQDYAAAPSDLHPFTGTEQLIQDAIEQLKMQGNEKEGFEDNESLLEKVEKESGQNYEVVKSELAERIQENVEAGKIDVTDLTLSEKTMSKLMEEVLYENYLYQAITDIEYHTESRKVTEITFTATEGYQSAVEAIEAEKENEVEIDAASLITADDVAADPQAQAMAVSTFALDADTPSCRAHTVDKTYYGDIDHNNTVDAVDRDLVRDMILEEEYNAAADMDKNETVDVKDIAAMRAVEENKKFESISGDQIQFTWMQKLDYTPKFKTNEKGQLLDQDGNVTNDPQKAAVENGGLLYDPETKQITQGILPDVYWALEKVEYTCPICGEEVVLTRDNAAEQLDQMVVRYEIYVDMTKFNPQTGEGIVKVPSTDPQPEETETFIHTTQVSVAQFMDDTFSVDANGMPAVDGNGNVIGLFVDTNGGNNDNGNLKLSWYYNVLSAFNADHAEYYGVSADYWTSMNSEANPMAAVKSLCNIDPNTDIPPAIMGQLVQMLPQAFMSYVYFYGNELLAMRDQAMALVDSLPSNATDIQKFLVLHDWLAENAVFDMGAMVNVTGSGGNPETDPIQMTPFGSMLSGQLTEMSGSGYYGCICLGYASAYTYLIQNAFPKLYKNSDGSWKTPEEVNTAGGDIIDFGQVMFYADTAETSIAGEGFGGGFFNNVHYYNMVNIKNSPTSKDEDNRMIGDWFFVDTCYDDIFVECLTQLRGEADGALHHDYFLASPETMYKSWGHSMDYLSHLYDGYTYQIKRDANGNPVPYPTDDNRYNPDDPGHPQYERVENPNEKFNDNTCYEDTWFSGAVSKIYNDGKNWYYVDAESVSTGFADKLDEDGNLKFDMEQMDKMNIEFKTALHSNRVDAEKGNKLKSRPMKSPDYWKEKENKKPGIMGQVEESYKEDIYATDLFDYGTGKFSKNPELDFSDEVKEDFVYNEQYPGLTHSIGMYDGKIYFNLGNDVYAYTLADASCTLVKSYHGVSGTSDGRAFTASSYTIDPAGKDIHVENGPIAGLLVRTANTPLYDYVDQNGNVTIGFDGKLGSGYKSMKEAQAATVNRRFNMMAQQPVMTVNVATNVSFTAGFEDGMTTEQQVAARYTKEAVNYSSEYSRWVENQITDPSKKDTNDNKEFLWCANIREDVPINEFAAGAPTEPSVTCTAQEMGHEYVYNEAEEAYICKNCHLHAANVVKEDDNFDVTMKCYPRKGLGDLMESEDETVVPVNPEREAASTKDGKIVVTVKPAEGAQKEITGISYISATADPGTEPVEITETDEDGNYVIQKTENMGCIEISVMSEDTFAVNVEKSEHGKVTASRVQEAAAVADEPAAVADEPADTPKVLRATADSTIKLDVTADEGYRLDTLTVKTASGKEVEVTDTEAGKTFTMPKEDVTVQAVFELIPETFTVTYNDGAEGTVFEPVVIENVEDGSETPAFNNGTDPVREGYTFKGWSPAVAETVTEDVTYTATWEAIAAPDPDAGNTPDPDAGNTSDGGAGNNPDAGNNSDGSSTDQTTPAL